MKGCTTLLLLHLMEFCDYFFRMFSHADDPVYFPSSGFGLLFQLEKQLLKLPPVQCSC